MNNTKNAGDPESSPFPWDAGAFDAHCHPVQFMDTIPNIPRLRTHGIIVMASRAEDQDFVAEVANQYGLRNREEFFKVLGSKPKQNFMIPSFGWHPWHCHDLYDDVNLTSSGPSCPHPNESQQAFKQRHYSLILKPPPPPDDPIITLFPQPRPLSGVISHVRANLERHALALGGEIGLDGAFRIPFPSPQSKQPTSRETPGGREGRSLTPFRVRLEHQQAVLRAQLTLAGELGRAVSIHGVQCHGALFNFLSELWKPYVRKKLSKRRQKRLRAHPDFCEEDLEPENGSNTRGQTGRLPPGSSDEHKCCNQSAPLTRMVSNSAHGFSSAAAESGDGMAEPEQTFTPPPKTNPIPPRLCLHSFSGPPEMAKCYLNPEIPVQVFFSFSRAVNLGADDEYAEKLSSVLKVVPANRILCETDLPQAGESLDNDLEHIYRFVCCQKGWTLEEGVKIIGKNYELFVVGTQ